MTRKGYRISRTMVPADSMALVTLAQAKAVLGIDPADTSQDAALTQHIDQVSLAIGNYCDRIFVHQTYRDQFRYTCSWIAPGEPLRVRQFPIVTDVAGAPLLIVTEDGAAVDPAGIEIDSETGLVYRLTSTLGVGTWTGMSIVTDYDGGFEPIPADVQGAALEWITARWAARGRDPALRSETIPDVISQVWATTSDMTSSTFAVPGGVQSLLAPYRLWWA